MTPFVSDCLTQFMAAVYLQLQKKLYLSADYSTPVRTIEWHHEHVYLSHYSCSSLECRRGLMQFIPGTKHPAKTRQTLGWHEINVNVYAYSLISHRVQQTSQFTPLVLELSLVRSHLLWGEFSAFSAAIAIHNSPLFVPPGTHHCWVDRGGMI